MNKLIVCGSGRHGKDTVCEYLQARHGMTFASSSWFLAERVIWPVLGNLYNTLDECFEDRHNHRDIWYKLISEYNESDPARLGSEIFEQYDIYCGLRNRHELVALKQQFNPVVIWVDRSQLVPYEPSTSLTITENDADYVLDNNYTLSHLYDQVDNLILNIG